MGTRWIMTPDAIHAVSCHVVTGGFVVGRHVGASDRSVFDPTAYLVQAGMDRISLAWILFDQDDDDLCYQRPSRVVEAFPGQ